MSAHPFECKLCGHTTLHVDPRGMFCGNAVCSRFLELGVDPQPTPDCNCEQALRLQARVTELESQLKAACIERDSALLLLRKELNAL